MKEKYIAFIDVLGYGALVQSKSIDTNIKIKSLIDIYENLINVFNMTKKDFGPDLFAKSFSDSIYIHTDNLHSLLYFCKIFYSNFFTFYYTIDKSYTPLLRCGIVKDWILIINDVAEPDKKNNPIGLGVARAYNTSEKSSFSGMRIIISDEVIKDLESENNYLQTLQMNLHFLQLNANEKGQATNLYELIWPDYDIANIDAYLTVLKRIRKYFPPNTYRHYNATIDIFIKSVKINENNLKESSFLEQLYKLKL